MPTLAVGPERALTWAGEPVNTHAVDPDEPKDKLDTATAVNGPEDETLDRDAIDGHALDWDTIDWRVHEGNVVRLRRRIFTATREQDWTKVRSLQKLMLKSWSNTLISVRQVTQRNTGRRTAGIDGQVALSSPARAEMAARVHATISSWQPVPVRRVYIPKPGKPGRRAKRRPLGIPSDHGSVPSGAGPSRTGAGVGGPVRAPLLRVPARAQLR